MLFYIETSIEQLAYADQELKTWDRIKGKLNDDVLAQRTADIKVEVATHIREVFDPTTHKIEEKPVTTPIYICSWDGLSLHVNTLIGTFPKTGIKYFGWPQTDVPPVKGN